MMKVVTVGMMLSLGVLTMAVDSDTVSDDNIVHSNVEKVRVGLCQLSIAATDTHKQPKLSPISQTGTKPAMSWKI